MQVKSSPLEHSAILLTCIKQLSILKTNFLSSFEWPLKTCFTVCHIIHGNEVQELTSIMMVWLNFDSFK